jgi:hypothetical protein
MPITFHLHLGPTFYRTLSNLEPVARAPAVSLEMRHILGGSQSTTINFKAEKWRSHKHHCCCTSHAARLADERFNDHFQWTNHNGRSDILWRNDNGAMAEWLVNSDTIRRSMIPSCRDAGASRPHWIGADTALPAAKYDAPPVIVLIKSRVERASRSSRVTIKTSPPSTQRAGQRCS